MAEEEESKKTEFAKISPIKVEKAMTASEIEAHKKQLEQYYSGQKVEEIEKILSDSQQITAAANTKKHSKVKFFVSILVFVFFWLGVLMSYFLDK